MSWRLRVFAIALVLGVSSVREAAADSAIRRQEVRLSQAFGLLIGDKFHRDIILELESPYQLRVDALPAAGRLTHWLTLEAPGVASRKSFSTTEYHLRFTYQLINVDPEVTEIGLPGILLKIGDGSETQQTLIPAARLRIGTVSDFSQADLKPAIRPVLLNRSPSRLLLWAVALGGALVALGLLHWRERRGGQKRPFANLSRRLAADHVREWAAERYDETLRTVHRAFDATAGKTVFGDALDGFLAEHIAYAPLAGEIRRFFASSSNHFFRSSGQPVAFDYSPSELRTFVAACAEVEGGFA